MVAELVGFFIAVCLICCGWIVWRSSQAQTALVLREFDLHVLRQGEEPPLLEVVGRRAGLISYLLTLLGLQSEVRLDVTSRVIELNTHSFFSVLKMMVPLNRVASITGGYQRLVRYLVVAGIFLLAMLISLAASMAGEASIPRAINAVVFSLSSILAGLAVFWYLFSKNFVLSITTFAGHTIWLRFKPSLIEGQMVDFDKVLAAIDVLNELVLGTQTQIAASQLPQSPPAPPPLPERQPRPGAQPRPTPAAAPSPGAAYPGQAAAVDPASAGADVESQAEAALAEALQVYRQGNHREGVQLLERLSTHYPNTNAGQKARAYLARLKR